MREARFDENAQGLFHSFVESGVGEAGSADHLRAVPMQEQDLAHTSSVGHGPLVPLHGRIETYLAYTRGKGRAGHLVEQVLLVLEVPVDGGRLDVERGCEPTEGEAIEAHFVEQFEGGGYEGGTV